MMKPSEYKAQEARHKRLLKVLAEVYWKSTAPYPDHAVKSAALFLDISEVRAKNMFEMDPQ
jgi:hypothetical protein